LHTRRFLRVSAVSGGWSGVQRGQMVGGVSTPFDQEEGRVVTGGVDPVIKPRVLRAAADSPA
jgi:hypothetical protein